MNKARASVLLCVALAFPAPSFAAERIRVLTSVFPLREFAAAIVGDRGEAAMLLPPGASVHTWQPRPGDILRLASSDLFIAVGSGLEPWLSDVLRAVPGGKLRLLETSRGLALLRATEEEPAEASEEGHAHGPVDPHFWLDFGLDELVADRIAASLTEIDPADAGYFRRNAAALKDRLAELDARFRQGLGSCPARQFVVAGHAAFGYLAHRYGLVQTALYGLSPDAQPRPQQMTKIIDACRKLGLRTVFFETSVPPDLARTLAAEIGGRVLVLYAGHNLTRDQVQKGVGFFDMMEQDLRSLRDGLGCR